MSHVSLQLGGYATRHQRCEQLGQQAQLSVGHSTSPTEEA
jgi:hypothetical protein